MKREWEENITCNYCGSSEKRLYLHNPKKNWYGKPLRLVECVKCHLVYADPRPTFKSILPTYQESNWAKEITLRKLKRPQVNLIHRQIVLDAMHFHPNPKSLFDVGYGAGTLMMEARKLGLEAEGNEINHYAIELMRKHGFTVYESPTHELKLDKKYDIMTALDYVEHSMVPFTDLKWMSNHLNPAGILYLKTLYLGCPNHKRMGDDWNLFEQGHFHYFYPNVLRNMLHDAGFKILEQRLTDAIIHIIARKVR